MKLDIGCGTVERRLRNNTLLGWIGLDYKDYDQQIIHDITKFPYPFKANTFEVIHSKHCIENTVGSIYELKTILEEWYRISKPSCKWKFVLPHWTRGNRFLQHRLGFGPDFLKNFVSKEVDSFGSMKFKRLHTSYKWRTTFLPKNLIVKFFNECWSNILSQSEYMTEYLWCYMFGGIEEFTIIVEVEK